MRNLKRFTLIAVLIAMLVAASLPAAAQDGGSVSPYPQNTITVTGYGSARGNPDSATIEVGVEVINANVAEAFGQANNTVENVINALVETGVAREDIRTTNLSIYNRNDFNPQSGMEEIAYAVSNNVRITVRDIANIENAINAAVNAGANQIYGLSFNLSDPRALESDARSNAMDDARARAEQLASLIGATLGDVVVVVEGGAGPGFPIPMFDSAMGRGGGGAVIEPGQSEVQVALQVTFRINR